MAGAANAQPVQTATCKDGTTCVFEAILELQAVQKTPGQALH
jgi:hypothetical protein